MIELSFSDVSLTQAVVDRWQEQVRSTVAQLRHAGITSQPGPETLHELDNGSLRMTAEYAPGFSIVMTAEPGEWLRVSTN